MARIQKRFTDLASARMWKLDARALRARAKAHDLAISDEHLSRRIDRSRARLGLRGASKAVHP